MMAYVITLLLLIGYLYGLYWWFKKIKWRFSPRVSRIIKYVHYVGIVMCMGIAFIYSEYNFVLRGLWMERIIINATIIIGFFFVLVSDKKVYNSIEEIYFRVFSFVPAVSLAFLCVPFLGVIIVGSAILKLTVPTSHVYYDDEHLRIQEEFMGVMGPHAISWYKKKGFYEIKSYSKDVFNFDSLHVKYDKDSTRILYYSTFNDTLITNVQAIRKVEE